MDPAFLQRPSGQNVESAPGDFASSTFGAPRLQDFTAVGPVVTANLLTDWTATVDGRSVAVSDWPLELQFMRRGGRYLAVRMTPRGRMDGGEMLGDGTYHHPGLKVSLAPRGVSVQRGHDELCEMQVVYAPSGDDAADVRFQVLGHRAAPGDGAGEVRLWLTAGAIALRGGAEIADRASVLVGPSDRRIAGERMDLVFGQDGAGWARERWTFVTLGLRHFLIKAVARGRTEAEARARFETSQGWFDDMGRTIHVE